MFLAVDIGNTTVSIAVIKKNPLKPLRMKIVSIRQVETFAEMKILRQKLR